MRLRKGIRKGGKIMLYERYPALRVCEQDIERAAALLIGTYENGGKLLVCGNGGSAADCEHIVGELMKGFLLERPVTDKRLPGPLRKSLQGALPAISLPSQCSIFTAYANDKDPDMVFAQLVYGYARPEDLVLGISTSGNSKNVVHAVETASALGVRSIGLTGEKESLLSGLCTVTIRVPAQETYKVQELHLPVYHYLCIRTEEHFFGVKS